MLDTRSTLADLATRHAGATEVFHRHRLDFCCGGGRSLADACRERDLDPALVARELEAAMACTTSLAGLEGASLAVLIDTILARYHDRLRGELPRLIDLAGKVESRHAAHPARPHGLADHLDAMQAAIEEHLAKEEQVLFPMIRAGHGRFVEMPVRVMRQEHDEHGRNLRELRRRAGDYETPPDACPSWQALALGLRRLEHELMDHIHLENNVLFPRALAGEHPEGGPR
jgi:regulator of cell morphogenesis and NO signaling